MIAEPPVHAVCRLRRQTAWRFSPKAKYGKRSGAGLVTSLMRHSVTQLREATRHKPRHSPPRETISAPLFRGEHMNPIAKAILRVVAVTTGTAYFLSTFYLVSSVRELKTTQMAIGWYGTAVGQMLIGLIFVGIGLGVVSLRFGKEKPE